VSVGSGFTNWLKTESCGRSCELDIELSDDIKGLAGQCVLQIMARVSILRQTHLLRGEGHDTAALPVVGADQFKLRTWV
jgi:hypothetical protein